MWGREKELQEDCLIQIWKTELRIGTYQHECWNWGKGENYESYGPNRAGKGFYKYLQRATDNFDGLFIIIE